jgi:hypothetical protein
MVVAEKPSDLVGCFVGLADDVNLGTIAGREDDQLPSDTAPCQFCQGGFDAFAREIDGLPQFDGRSSVTQSDGEEAHH